MGRLAFSKQRSSAFGAPTPRRWVSTAVPWVPIVRGFGCSFRFGEGPNCRTTEPSNAFGVGQRHAATDLAGAGPPPGGGGDQRDLRPLDPGPGAHPGRGNDRALLPGRP